LQEWLTTLGLLTAALVAFLGLVVWIAAQTGALISHGRSLPSPPADAVAALLQLPRHVNRPREAWPPAARTGFPDPVLFYGLVVLLLTATTSTAGWALGAWRRHRAGSSRRDRDRSYSWARARQVPELVMRRPDGQRILLGQLGRTPIGAQPRRSVLLVAPTQAGKTTRFVVPAVLRWQGPMVITSVKPDVLHLTHQARARRGGVMVFDPTGTLAETNIATCWWSPLLAADTFAEAERTAAWMVEAAGNPGGDNAQFWESLAGKLLAVLLFAGAHADHSLATLARWVDRRDVPAVSAVVEWLGDEDAKDAWAACCARDERQCDSVYATLETLLAPFSSPSVRASVLPDRDRDFIDPDRLLDENAALYLVAPVHEQNRLRPLFEALIQTVIRAAQDRHARSGRPLEPALLLMLDEAAHVAPLRSLPALAATGAGQGIQICSVWQDLAQIEQLYSRGARSLINNHTARVFLPGNGDVTTLDELSRLLADHPAIRLSRSHSRHGSDSITVNPGEERLAPLDYLRQLPADTALVLYGRLPPLRLKTRGYWQQSDLAPLITEPFTEPEPSSSPPNHPISVAGSPQPGGDHLADSQGDRPTGITYIQEALMPIPSEPDGPRLLDHLEPLVEYNRAIDVRTGRRYQIATGIDGTAIPVPEELTEQERAELDALHDSYRRRIADAATDLAHEPEPPAVADLDRYRNRKAGDSP
jgi:type IV secretory pathway TraG/TraD family ATPase VirD4